VASFVRPFHPRLVEKSREKRSSGSHQCPKNHGCRFNFPLERGDASQGIAMAGSMPGLLAEFEVLSFAFGLTQ